MQPTQTVDKESKPVLFRTKRMLLAFDLGFAGFITFLGAHFATLNLPGYPEHVRIGPLMAGCDHAENIAKLLFGAFGDKYGTKDTMVSSVVFFILASFFYHCIDLQISYRLFMLFP